MTFIQRTIACRQKQMNTLKRTWILPHLLKRIGKFCLPSIMLGSGIRVKGAYLPVEIFARIMGENTTACPLTE